MKCIGVGTGPFPYVCVAFIEPEVVPQIVTLKLLPVLNADSCGHPEDELLEDADPLLVPEP